MKFYAWIIFLTLAVAITVADYFVERDDTDAQNRRSGMTLLTDNKTGCQYLSHRGGITPRLTADGRQLGCH